MEWFRFWNQTINCLKVQRLPGETYKAWSNMLCLASIRDEGGKLPPAEEIAFALRVTSSKTAAFIRELVSVGLIDEDDATGELTMHDWQHWQPPRDDAAGRMRRYRERKASGSGDGPVAQPLRNAGRNVSRNGDVIEAEAEQKQRQTKKQKPPLPPEGGDAPPPADAEPPEYPDELTSMFTIMPGEHEITELEAREIWGAIWREWKDSRLCYEFYQHQQWVTVAGWKHAIKTAIERKVKPNSVRYLETIGVDADINGIKEKKPVTRGQIGVVPFVPASNQPPTVPADYKPMPGHTSKKDYEAKRARAE